jgi:hypothetical protein
LIAKRRQARARRSRSIGSVRAHAMMIAASSGAAVSRRPPCEHHARA